MNGYAGSYAVCFGGSGSGRRPGLRACGRGVLLSFALGSRRRNGRGRWWNSGASHMNEAFPKRYFDNIGLLSLLTTVRFAH